MRAAETCPCDRECGYRRPKFRKTQTIHRASEVRCSVGPSYRAGRWYTEKHLGQGSCSLLDFPGASNAAMIGWRPQAKKSCLRHTHGSAIGLRQPRSEERRVGK